MNIKSTVVLVVLAVAAGAWLWKGDEWGPRLGLKVGHSEAPAASPAAAVLDSLAPENLTRIEVTYPSTDKLELDRTGPDAAWKLPGNWPPRKPEVDELVQALGHLRTRFLAVPLPESADLKPYGLAPDQKPLTVKVSTKDRIITLTFGNPTPGEGETEFTRPAFVRVDDTPEVLRVGPDVMPVVGRPAEVYRRRQLFTDVERVKLLTNASPPTPFGPPGGDTPVAVTILGRDTASIQVSQTGAPSTAIGPGATPDRNVNFTLTRVGQLPEPAVYARGGEPAIPVERLADGWAVYNRPAWLPAGTNPDKDRVEPERLRTLLTAVADLWVDQFVPSADEAMDVRLAVARNLTLPTAFDSVASIAARVPPLSADLRMGFDEKEKSSITVKRANGEAVTVRFGGIAKVLEREEKVTLPTPPGMPPGMPPQTETKKTSLPYRFGRIDGNAQMFVVSAGKFSDLFVDATKLIDDKVARFSADEVQELVVRHAGGPEVKLFRKKGNPKATDFAETQDRWFLDAKPNPLPADPARVSELLDQLSGFRAEGPDRTTYPKSAPPADTTVSLVLREKRAEGEPDAPTRTLTLEIGAPDPVKQLLPVQLAGWPRVSLVMNKLGPDEPGSWISSLLFPKTVSALFTRPALAYRGRKLIDTVDETLTSVTVTAATGGFALAKSATGEWKLTAPLASEADPGKAGQLAATLSGLESTEYVNDAPTPEALKEYGLEKPAETVALVFSAGRNYKLELGGPRPGKPEVFARLDGGGVFGLPVTIRDQMTTGVVGLLPLRVWATLPEKVTELDVTRGGDAAKNSFALKKDGTNWQLTGPFTAPVPYLSAQPLLTTLGSLQAVKYQALTAANLAEYGLDKPQVRIKLTYLEKPPAAPGAPAGEDRPVTKTLLIGGLASPGVDHFAMLDAPHAPVFVVPAAFLVAAETSPLTLLDRSLLFLDTNRIAKVKFASDKPEDAFTLVKDEKGKWAAEGVSFAVDAERVNRLLATVSALPVTGLAAYGDAVKWADFGLEKPAATVTLTLSGDKPVTHTIALGAVDPARSQYVRVDDGKAVGLIPVGAAESLTRKKFDFADRTLLTFDPTTLLGLTRKQGKDELELAPAAAVGWDILKPAKQKADAVLMDELAESLGKLRAEKIAAYGKKEDVFKQYGLEPPAAVLTLTIGEKAEQKTLRLGNPVDPAKPEGERYAAIESSGPEAGVGVLPAALAGKLLAKDLAFRDHTLAKFLDADKAVLERGDRKITFAKVGVAWKVTEPLAAPAESGELEALVADFGKLRVDTWVDKKTVDLKTYGLDKPEARWTVSDGDKPVLTLLLGKKAPDGRVYAMTDTSELVGLLDPSLTIRVQAEYRQRKPWDLDPAQAQIVEVAKGEVKFEFQKAGPAWTDPAKPADPLDGRVVNELLGTLGALRAERYAVDKGADLKLYGLEKPEEVITVTAQNGQKQVLQIGGVVGGTDGKQRYARLADPSRTDVFVLSAADTLRLTRDRAEYGLKK